MSADVPLRTPSALRVRPRSAAALLAVSAVGLAAFCWPLWFSPSQGTGHDLDAPWLFVLLLPFLLAIVAAELSEDGMDAKSVALLGVLAGIGCALRVLGTGMAGLEPLFFLLIVAGRAFGAGFGFVLGGLTLLSSALITGGVGPWLPFQMLGCGWVALGAGLLPAVRGRLELILLAGYGALAGLVYGLLLDLWFWPFLLGTGSTATGLSFVPGDALGDNMRRFLGYHLITAMGYDIPRAALTAALCLLVGAPVLRTLRRAIRRAAFDQPIRFTTAGQQGGPGGSGRTN